MTRMAGIATLFLLLPPCGGGDTRTWTVSSGAMEPAIQRGDRISCTDGAPDVIERGAVVAFDATGLTFGPPGQSRTLVSRVVGLPRETIAGTSSATVIDGNELAEPYARPDGMSFGPVTVPPGHYFVMGDNRARSADSRVNGTIPRTHVRGVCTRIVSPEERRGRIPGT